MPRPHNYIISLNQGGLTRNNLLRTLAVVVRGKKRLLVPTDAIDQFEAAYVSAAELAHIRRTASANILAKLATLRAKPMTGPSVDNGRQYFFHRGAVSRVVLEPDKDPNNKDVPGTDLETVCAA